MPHSTARRWRTRAIAVTTVLAGVAVPLVVVNTADAAPVNATDIQMRVVSLGPVPGENRYRITVELHNNGPRDITQEYRFHTVFTTVVASSSGTTTTVTEDADKRPRPLLLNVGQVDIVSLLFDAPNACANVGCEAVIRLTDAAGNVINDRNPRNDTVHVVDGVIVHD